MSSFQQCIEHIYFINLDHRYDRAQDFYKMMEQMGISEESITRISAIFEPMNGALGCTKSHIKTIETFLQSNYKCCCVFEDDFDFISKEALEDFCAEFQTVDPKEWDMILFSGVIFQSEASKYKCLRRVFDLQTSSSYILTRVYAPQLLANLQESAEALEIYSKGTGRIIEGYCLDMYWKSLQKKDKWFVSYPLLGYQRPSYSDIEKKNVDYTSLEMSLNNQIHKTA